MSYTNQQKRILLVMSSNDEMGISGKQTGTWLIWHQIPLRSDRSRQKQRRRDGCSDLPCTMCFPGDGDLRLCLHPKSIRVSDIA